MSDLMRAVRINEEIKYVLDASRQINLVALNALLTARKAGARSLGFAVVARQLRELSRELEMAMESLDQAVSDLVSNIANAMKDVRMLHYVDLAGGIDGADAACLLRMEAALDGRARRRQDIIGQDWGRMAFTLTRILRLSEKGGVLSRSAKIEAAHGGEMAAVLTQVANRVEETILDITQRLRGLSKIAHHA